MVADRYHGIRVQPAPTRTAANPRPPGTHRWLSRPSTRPHQRATNAADDVAVEAIDRNRIVNDAEQPARSLSPQFP
jgi:hypothetical protein